MNHINQLQFLLSNSNIDALMLTDEISCYYASGFQAEGSLVFLTEKKGWFLTDSRYITEAELKLEGMSLIDVSKTGGYSSALDEIIKSIGVQSVGFEEASMSVYDFLLWKDRLSADLIPAQKMINHARMIKTTEDVGLIKQAVNVAESAFNDVLPYISPEVSERDLATALACQILQNGGDEVSFQPIVLSGERTSLPHAYASNQRIGRGPVLIDFGAKCSGWCSDITRMVYLGEPDEEMRRISDIIVRAQKAGISALLVGAQAKDADRAARDIIHSFGLAGAFGHSFGHGVGLEVHEGPAVGPGSTQKLLPGMVLTAEPGVYLPKKYGVRIEDMVLLKESGLEMLTTPSKELIIL